MSSSYNYKTAGVDIEAGNLAVKKIKKAVEKTFSPHVLTRLGAFGAMFDLKAILASYKHPVLVQSIDGVGTKIMIASRMQKFDTIGIDLVSATTNDIIVLGAKPLTLLDYIANDKLNPDIVSEIVAGMAEACCENGISLVGGETAEMPGTYQSGEHDLVGVITGVVEKDEAITGKDICPGDVILALPSSGLHTNGYSLARKLLFDVAGYDVHTKLTAFSASVGEELLKPHINYTRPIHKLLDKKIPIKGMAHITGGGVLENIPRVLPAHCSVEISKTVCPVPTLFHVMREIGKLNDDEMYRTFNMGIGLVLIVAPETVQTIKAEINDVYELGKVVPGSQEVRLV